LRRFAVPFIFVDRVSFSPDRRQATDRDTMVAASRFTPFCVAVLLVSSLVGSGCSSDAPSPPVVPARQVKSTALPPPHHPESTNSATSVQSAPPIAANDPRMRTLRNLYAFSSSVHLAEHLRAARHEFEEIAVTVADEPLKWNALQIARVLEEQVVLPVKLPKELLDRLREPEHRFNAFRFRSPLKEPADLHWAYGVSEQVGRWYIVRVNGPMNGFDTQQRDWNLDIPEAPLPPGNEFVFQELLGGKILPGEEYILWFVLPDDAPTSLYAALRLTPVGTHRSATSAEEIAKCLGIQLKPHTFPQTPAGLQAAFDAANHWSKLDHPQPKALRRILESVWSMLPEIRVGTESGTPIWNPVVSNSPFQFCAVRFRSPLDQPADLRTCTVNDRIQIRQGVIARTGDVKHWSRDWLEVNLPFRDGIHSDENLTNLRELLDGQIQPDQEYVLWFAPYRKALPEFDVAVHLSKAGSIESVGQGRSSAPVFGLVLENELSPRRVDAALDLCHVMAQQKSSRNSTEFDRLLQFAAPALPILRMSTEEAVWNACQLNRRAAYRIEDEARTGNMAVAIARSSPLMMNWGIVGLDDPGLGEGYRMSMLSSVADLPKSFGDHLEASVYFDLDALNPQKTIVFCYQESDGPPMSVQIAARANITFKLNQPIVEHVVIDAMALRSSNLPGDLVGSHGAQVLAMRFLSESLLATSSVDNTVRLWNLNDKQSPLQLNIPSSQVTGLAVSPDHNLLACASSDLSNRASDFRIQVCDAKTLTEQRRLVIPDGYSPQFIEFSPDGRSILACDGGGWKMVRNSTLCLWNLDQEGPPRVLTFEDKAQFHAAGWLADGKTIVVSGGCHLKNSTLFNISESYRGEIRLIDSDSLQVTKTLSDPGEPWIAQAVSADGKRIAVLSSPGYINILDSNTLQSVGQLIHSDQGKRIGLSSDGSRLVSLTRTGAVLIWDVDQRRMIREWPSREPQISAVAISPSGKTVACGGNDSQIRRIDVGDSPLQQNDRILNSLQMELALIPAGEFVMGSGGDVPKHQVKFSNSFYLGTCEVTVAQFRSFVDATGYRTTAETSGKGGLHQPRGKQNYESSPEWNWKNPGFEQDDRHPVVQISWHDAVAFCEWLSVKEGKTCRLPTEAEWEYACRAGSNGNWFWGNESNLLPHGANIADLEIFKFYGKYKNAFSRSDGFAFTAPVASYAANRFGLFDMHGNAHEWCSDWYEPTYYSTSPADNPTGPKTGTHRVQRSCSFAHQYRQATSAYRDSDLPETAASGYGFRIVQEIP
jgi:formylglycine-generating enzyme required for sulfatase activity